MLGQVHDPDLHLLRLFVTVAEAGGFSAAALKGGGFSATALRAGGFNVRQPRLSEPLAYAQLHSTQ